MYFVLFPPRSVESKRTRAHLRRSCTKTATSKHNSRFVVFLNEDFVFETHSLTHLKKNNTVTSFLRFKPLKSSCGGNIRKRV